MVAVNENAWAFRGEDNLDRSHIPSIPLWSGFVRIAQLVLAFLILVMTGVSAGIFKSGNLAGFGLAWFAFIWTFGYLIWLFVSVAFQPVFYNYWAHLALEALATLWWLCAFALLASEASQLAEYESYYDYLSAYSSLYDVDTGVTKVKTAINLIKASAGIGALEWLLFVVSLVFLIISILQQRKTQAPANTTGVEAAPAPAPAPVPTQMQQQPIYQQPQPVYQQQQPVYQQQPAPYPQQ